MKTFKSAEAEAAVAAEEEDHPEVAAQAVGQAVLLGVLVAPVLLRPEATATLEDERAEEAA